jgi:hypothetical protein
MAMSSTEDTVGIIVCKNKLKGGNRERGEEENGIT